MGIQSLETNLLYNIIFQFLSNFCLNTTMFAGRAFQISLTLWLKNLFLHSRFDLGFCNFRWWPVRLVELIVKKFKNQYHLQCLWFHCFTVLFLYYPPTYHSIRDSDSWQPMTTLLSMWNFVPCIRFGAGSGPPCFSI